jgi:hypothetical protein
MAPKETGECVFIFSWSFTRRQHGLGRPIYDCLCGVGLQELIHRGRVLRQFSAVLLPESLHFTYGVAIKGVRQEQGCKAFAHPVHIHRLLKGSEEVNHLERRRSRVTILQMVSHSLQETIHP